MLKRFEDSARRTSLAECGDETGLEAFANHVHVEELLDDATPHAALPQALAFVPRLARALAQAYPGEQFVALISVSDSCTLRFHKVRPGQSWLADDLESYTEAVMSIALP